MHLRPAAGGGTSSRWDGGCTTSPVGAQFTWASATGGTGMDSSDSGLVKTVYTVYRSTVNFSLNTAEFFTDSCVQCTLKYTGELYSQMCTVG